jgi:hypothetical protein
MAETPAFAPRRRLLAKLKLGGADMFYTPVKV